MQIVLIHKQALSQFTSFQRRAKFPEHSCNVVPILTRRKSVSNELRRMIMARHSSNKFKRFAASRLKFIPNKLAALLYVEPSITTEKMKSQVKHEILEKYIILCKSICSPNVCTLSSPRKDWVELPCNCKPFFII